MKYLRKFNTSSEYNSFIESTSDYPNVCLITEDGSVAYNPPPPLPLYVEAIDTIRVTFNNYYEYSKDNRTWEEGTSSSSVSASAGERVYLRSSSLTESSGYGIGAISIGSGRCNLGGNVMSMAYGANFNGRNELTQPYQFRGLFAQNDSNKKNIIDASSLVLPATTLTEGCYYEMFGNNAAMIAVPELPATTMGNSCYGNMFYKCASLVNAPELPATTLAESCYNSMFQGCTSLLNAPMLPAIVLAKKCYQYMFRECSSLTDAPALPATTLASYCYYYMFRECTSLVNAPALPATELKGDCYGGMFYGCTSLVAAPELPATNLVLSSACYSAMFSGCSKLAYIKAMFTTTPSSTYMGNWVKGVASSGTFVKNSAATWADSFGVSAIPSGWTVETADA